MPWMIPAAIIAGSVLSSEASKDAAKQQGAGADKATQAQMAMFGQTQQNMAPWLSSGQLSLQQLSRFAGLPGFSADPSAGIDFKGAKFDNMDSLHKVLYDDYLRQVGDPKMVSEAAIQKAMGAATQAQGGGDPMFGAGMKPFGMADFQASPAYQFNLSEGEKAINKAAAARGKFYAPGTLQDIGKYSQGVASNEFQNAYNNYNTNMGNIWSRLSTLSGAGQNAAGNLGTNASQVAGQVGNNITGAANASAAGTIGSANAISGGVGNAYNNYLMQQILAGNQQSSVPSQGGMLPGAGELNQRYS